MRSLHLPRYDAWFSLQPAPPLVLVTPKGSTQCYQWEQFSLGARPLTLTLPSKRFQLRVTHRSGSDQEPSAGLEVLAWPEQSFGRAHATCTERRGVTDAKGKVDLETSYTEELEFPPGNFYGAPCCR